MRTDPDDEMFDFLTLAAGTSPHPALAYHTALECHGSSRSYFETLYFVTWIPAAVDAE